MPVFPSAEWMRAYAATVAAHPQAETLTRALEGRYRFVVTPAGGLTERSAYDLLVAPGAVTAADVNHALPTVLTVTADYPRWKGLLSGEADILRSFLMRRIKVEGSLMSLRQRISDAGPLLACLRDVPTTFPH